MMNLVWMKPCSGRKNTGVREGGNGSGTAKEQRKRKKTDQSVESMEGVESQEGHAPGPSPVEILRKIVSCLEELRKCLKLAPHTTVSGILCVV